LGIHSIDRLIITHFHSDHVGGLPAILQDFMTKTSDHRERIFVPFLPDPSENKPKITVLINQLKQYPIHILRQGDIISKTSSLKIEVLHPEKPIGNQNEDSLILKITHGKICFLLMADAGLKAQRKLYEDYGAHLKCDLMKIPHHANDTEAFLPFLECAKPQISILTIGENDYQAPNAHVLTAYQEQSKTLYRTDHHGNITAISNGATLHIKCGWT
jgi:beta-lactamase superfamily II metal-dependent hydrolase